MRKVNLKFFPAAVLSVAALVFTGCQPSGGTGTATNPAAGDTAATVNGKAIKMEAVEKVIKAQSQGQELRVSPLELAAARMQILQQLIQQEVMFQKAEAEKTVPTDDEVNQQFNKMKTESGKSAEEIAKQMQDAGETEATVKEGIRKDLAINKLIEKITGKVDAPKDSEIDAFYKGNPEAFIKKKGVKLAAIVVDPANNGEGDTTTDAASAAQKMKDIAAKLNQGADFATVARESSEDQSRLQGGDLGYIGEDQLKQNYPQLAAGFMNPQFPVGKVAGPFNIEGRFYIFKLQERSDKDENMTLESPGVKQQITDALINSRKKILGDAYATIAMNEAKVENFLAKKIVENPNELSGARPASSATPTPANTNANTGANVNANANAARPAAANAPAANAPVNTAGNKANTNR